ncbi:MAG: hypothetical protein JNJ61_27235 [Anaerolineae bacterium]|nr:hypothetical protein [Anaerolineae bacterium]
MVEADPVLGAFVAAYPSNRARLLIPALIVGGAVAVVLNFTTGAVEAWWGPVVTVALMALVALGLGWRVLHFWNREIMLFEQGFSYREGARTVFFHYLEIISIRQRAERLAYFGGLIRRTSYHYTVSTIKDEQITLNNLYKDVDQLMERVEAKVTPLLDARITAQIKAGESVAFSKSLRISRDGLHEGGRALPWADFAGYKASAGHLLLLARPGDAEWFRIPLAEIDNLAVLIGLLRRYTTR